MKPLYGRGLPRCAFLDQAQNVLMIGGPDAGKTHLATVLEVQVIRHCQRWTPSIGQVVGAAK